VGVIPAGWHKRRKNAGRSCFKPGSNSIAPMAAVLPALKICMMPVRTPDSLTMRATASVRSCISPEWCVCSVIFPLEDHALIMLRLLTTRNYQSKGFKKGRFRLSGPLGCRPKRLLSLTGNARWASPSTNVTCQFTRQP
jgi:hypothetical protein